VNAVFDTGVVVSAIYWQSEPRRCLGALARRRFRLFVSDSILEEYERVAWEVRAAEQLDRDPIPALAWIKRTAHWAEPHRLPQSVCRDPSDDKFPECALAARATFLVSRDGDLLVLRKPFGIEVVTPRMFLSRLAAAA
jgi:uncharacterized protein